MPRLAQPIISVAAILIVSATLLAQTASPPATTQPAMSEPAASKTTPKEPKTWLEHCAGWKDEIDKKYGTKAGVMADYVNQWVVGGEHRNRDFNVFGYRFDLGQNIWTGGQVNLSVEGGTGQGPDRVLGTLLGLNNDANEPACVYVSRLYLQQEALDKKLLIAVGKIDLADYFDTNAVANCEHNQFLSQSLVNNPAIPFPQRGLGITVKATPTDWFYVQAGVADANAKKSTTGFKTTFHNGAEFFSIYELGFTPTINKLPGNYRFLFWYNPGPVDRVDGTGSWSDDTGFALSFDQQVTDRITLFARYGLAREEAHSIQHFWSLGGQLAKPLPGRDDDIFAIGIAQGVLGRSYVDSLAPAATHGQETLFETYYSIKLHELVYLSPMVQVALDPTGDAHREPDVIVGTRLFVKF